MLTAASSRIWLLPLGVAGVLWSLNVLPSFLATAPLRDWSAQIIADETFKVGTFTELARGGALSAELWMLEPARAQAEALIHLRAAEEAIRRKNSEEADRAVEAALTKVRSALAVTPTDSLLWLLIYSVETSRGGVDPQYVRYLDQSYRCGPYEGWLMLRRNGLALAIFPTLTNITQEAVISEFAEMVDADFLADAAKNLTTVGWAYRARLLPKLEQITLASRQSFARALSGQGYKVPIPGIVQHDRPWR
ncbi:hypothetical protein ACFQX9_18230 [Bradyrhizobium sp. GCM10028915]|uniref:hypothetical protein n=1 Tax=Bradyrhizobium sp. GCM10028915 TaxID=3273385 RepID=UPI00360C95F5